MKRKFAIALFAVIVLLIAIGAVPASSQYAVNIIDLGTFGGPYANATGINNNGHVVGESSYASGETHAFLWTKSGGMQDLGTLGQSFSTANDINDLGQIVGASATSCCTHAFLWTQTTGMQDLGTLGGMWGNSGASSINNAGHVVGTTTVSNGQVHAFIWTAGNGMMDLGTLPGGNGSIAVGINNSGQVVGYSDTPSGNRHAFIWTAAGGMKDLGTLPGGIWSEANAINDSGQVVGVSATSSAFHAFIWTVNEGMSDLGSLGGGEANAININNFGQIVGWSLGQHGYHGFIWEKASGMKDLGTLSNGSASRANAINDWGDIVGGSSNTPRGYNRAILWEAVKVVANIDSLIADKERTCSLGWINQASVCTSLDAKLTAAKSALERVQNNIAKSQLSAFINELDAQKGKTVNQQAYDLLKADALYVIAHLP